MRFSVTFGTLRLIELLAAPTVYSSGSFCKYQAQRKFLISCEVMAFLRSDQPGDSTEVVRPKIKREVGRRPVNANT